MTTILNTELLLSTLVSRIRAMNTNPTGNTPASVLEDLLHEIHAGEYDADPVNAEAIPVRDPLEAAADRIIGSSGFMDTVREIPVGDVVSVQTILYRRADEHEKQAAVIRERRAQMTEALQGLLSPEKQAEAPTQTYAKMDEVRRMEREPDEHDRYLEEVRELGGDRPMSRKQFYQSTGLRDRNGGR